MQLGEIREILKANVCTGEDRLDMEVLCGCGSDLMSDVLAFVDESVLLLTGLVNPQVIRTAEMMDIKSIVFVRGKKPTQEMITLAESKEFVLLNTDYTLFTACGLLYQKGLKGKGGQ